MLKYLVAILIAFSISGCWYDNDVLSVRDKSGNDINFKGIIDVINEDGNTNILFIHGMMGYATDDNRVIDPCNVMNDVRDALNLDLIKYKADNGKCYDDIQYNGKKIRMSAMYWNGITASRKWEVILADNDTFFWENRSGVTDLVKNQLINSGFSDAIMYTGVYHEKIIKSVVSEYERMNRENPGAKTVIVSFSLGSAIMLDALSRLEKSGEGYLLQDKIEMIYMMANQIPLIRSGTKPLSKNDEKQLNPYQPLQKYFTKHKLNEKVRIVAFSDPNDILSYPISRNSMRELGLEDQYTNVAISIANKTYYAPFYKEYGVVNYLDAHLKYVHNKKLKKLLLYGNEK